MCGITGMVTTNTEIDYSVAIAGMLDKIISRGPDDCGSYTDEYAALGMRRLTIIGLVNGMQPIFNEDKTLVLVYNGEIYNYKQLKEELIEKGHIFYTDTDSEVLVHGYEEYGRELLQKLRGMFAFAIWNTVEKSLFVARDMFGIKPLFYSCEDKAFVFGSEIKAVLAHPNVKKVFNQDALEPYLSFQYNPTPETFYKGIFQLLPGHCLSWKDGKIEIECYWRVKWKINEKLTEEEAAKRIKDAMVDSVRAHEISDVKMGMFLSGGIDSSFIAGCSTLKDTYSVGFEGGICDETGLAEELCEHLHATNTKRLITKKDFWDGIPLILNALDEPVADPSIIPLYYLCELASRDVKVVLSGEGSDELFGGYTIYQTPLALKPVQWIPFGIRRAVSKFLKTKKVAFKGKEYLIRAGQTIEERFIGNAYVFKGEEIQSILKKTAGADNLEQKIVAPYYKEAAGLDDVTKMQYVDICFWLRGDILRKSDHISMANSLEVRVPFLDKEVAKAAFSLPTRYRVTTEKTKSMFRKVAEDFLPKKNADRRKLGFPVPLNQWIREENTYQIFYEAFSGEHAAQFFKVNNLIKLLKEHKSGKKNNARKIWNVYIFLYWYKMNFA